MIVWENLLVRSWNSPATATSSCDGELVGAGFEGLHVFDISDPSDPDLVGSVGDGRSAEPGDDRQRLRRWAVRGDRRGWGRRPRRPPGSPGTVVSPTTASARWRTDRRLRVVLDSPPVRSRWLTAARATSAQGAQRAGRRRHGRHRRQQRARDSRSRWAAPCWTPGHDLRRDGLAGGRRHDQVAACRSATIRATPGSAADPPATGVPDLANDRLLVYNSSSAGGTCDFFEIVEVPLDDPASAG